MKKISIKSAAVALAMFVAIFTGCGDVSSQTDESKVTESSSVSDSSSSEDSSSVADSSEYETTTTKTSLDESSDSEKTETTTKAVTDNSDKETKETTTTAKQTTAQPKATTTTKVATTTTTARATQSTAKPAVTTKATTKATTKQTTKATTKATSKQTADPTANMSPYYKALYRIGSGKGTTSDYETVRAEIINYGKKLYPTYKLNSNLHLYRLPNGKLTDNYQAGVSFNDVTCREACELPTANLQDIKAFDNDVKCLVVENLSMYRNYNPNDWNVMWYVQFSKQQIGTCVIVLVDAE